MNADQFVYWLNGYLELSGAQELNASQVRCVREHLALVLKKITPPGPAWQPSPGWKPFYRGGSALGGTQCGVCNRWTSNEGGFCHNCRTATTTTDSTAVVSVSQLEKHTCSPFVPSTPTSGYCDACANEQHVSELKMFSSNTLAGVVICKTCINQASDGAVLKSAENGMPILDVPLVLSC